MSVLQSIKRFARRFWYGTGSYAALVIALLILCIIVGLWCAFFLSLFAHQMAK